MTSDSSPAGSTAMAATLPRARITLRRVAIKRLALTLAAYVIMSGAALICLVPFIWMVSTSFKNLQQAFLYPPQWIPDPIVWKNYTDLFRLLKMARYTFNSAVYTVAVTAGQLVFCSMAGYSFARLRFPGRENLFLAYLGTMMVPSTVTIIPAFIFMQRIGWADTYYGLIIPLLFGSAYGTFLLRQFFMTLPGEIEDAALIDGCNRFQIFWSIFLPLIKPALATLTVLNVVTHWNELLWPLIIMTKDDHKLLSVAMSGLRNPSTWIPWTMIMAGGVLSLLPVLVVFFAAQRFFVQGIQFSGFK